MSLSLSFYWALALASLSSPALVISTDRMQMGHRAGWSWVRAVHGQRDLCSILHFFFLKALQYFLKSPEWMVFLRAFSCLEDWQAHFDELILKGRYNSISLFLNRKSLAREQSYNLLGSSDGLHPGPEKGLRRHSFDQESKSCCFWTWLYNRRVHPWLPSNCLVSD